MEKQELRFKTNINCGGCVATVKPHLDAATDIAQWQVDTGSKDKVLTVSLEGISEEQIVGLVKKAGFKIESLNN
jgi:copper chaperone CopZ